MTTAQAFEMEKQVLLGSYARPDFVLSHGKGMYVYDLEGRRYLDFVGGIAVNALGHCDDGAIAVLKEQAEKLWHCSNLYSSEPQLRLARLLTEHTFADKVFFSASGTEAVEGAIKFARKWARQTRDRDCFEIIACENSFHGRSMGALSLTGRSEYWEDFEPMLPGIRFAVFNDLDSVARAMTSRTCAVIVEPVQGEGGVFPADLEFLQGLRNLCSQNNALLILDEIQCGLGRTGTFCAYEQYNIVPDVMVIAKPLAGGLPMGAILVSDEVAQYIRPGNHGSTFGGGPLVACVAEYVIKKILEKEFLQRVKSNGEYLINRLQQLRQSFNGICTIRGKGLMIGMELSCDVKKVIKACAENGLLVCKAGENVLRMLPPLIVERQHIDEGSEILAMSLEKVRIDHVKKS
jgi:acetylornithine/N-succinyldiaminopimelate aminotransferase